MIYQSTGAKPDVIHPINRRIFVWSITKNVYQDPGSTFLARHCVFIKLNHACWSSEQASKETFPQNGMSTEDKEWSRLLQLQRLYALPVLMSTSQSSEATHICDFIALKIYMRSCIH